MFSNTIKGLINESGAAAASKRAAQIENMIKMQSESVSTIEPPKATEGPSFSQFMKMVPPAEFNFKLANPEKTYTRAEIAQIVNNAAEKYGVDKRLVNALIKQESGFNPKATSKAGAMGLMQLMPATAKSLGVTDAYNPEQNVEAGVKYLKGLLDKYNGNVILALAAYNAGPGNVAKYNGIPPFKETQNYVKSILANYL